MRVSVATNCVRQRRGGPSSPESRPLPDCPTSAVAENVGLTVLNIASVIRVVEEDRVVAIAIAEVGGLKSPLLQVADLVSGSDIRELLELGQISQAAARRTGKLRTWE